MQLVPPTADDCKRAAQYVRMSTDRQEYSTKNQMDTIAAYAACHGLTIVHTYEDSGRSGLNIGGRKALQKLIADVKTGKVGFHFILVYDVSRWGRFQDTDESAYYEFICKQAGLQVEYCAELFKNDGSVVSTILKNYKRASAGEFSRDLSTKVFIGQSRFATLGFWQGGPPGYGLRRLLLDESGKPKLVLENGQQKHLKTEHVILIPGPRVEVETVRRIFTMFAREKKTRTEIAQELNADGVCNANERPWHSQTIDLILRNEKYIGHNIRNRYSFKLQIKRVNNPPEMWIRRDNAFKAIVSPELFALAQKRRLDLKNGRKETNEKILGRLKSLWRRKGHLSAHIIAKEKTVPDITVYVRRFGSLVKTYEQIGFKPKRRYSYAENGAKINSVICATATDIVGYVERLGGQASFLRELYLLTLNGLTVVIAVAWSVSDGVLAMRRSRRWEVRKIKYRKSDLVLVVRMDARNQRIQDYFLCPAENVPLTTDRMKLRISDKYFGEFRLETFESVLAHLHGKLLSAQALEKRPRARRAAKMGGRISQS